MKKFIYVFSEKAAELLKASGALMLKSDDKNGVFVFEFKEGIRLDFSSGEEYVLSDTLTF